MIAEQWMMIRQGCKQPALAPSVEIEPDGSSNTYFIAPYVVLCSVWSTDGGLKQIVAMAGITNAMPWRDDACVIFMVTIVRCPSGPEALGLFETEITYKGIDSNQESAPSSSNLFSL